LSNPILKTYTDVFPVLKHSCSQGICIWISDTEKFIDKVQGKDSPGDAFEIGSPILAGGAARKAIDEKRRVFVELPEEVYGYEANVIAVPLFNPDNPAEVVGVMGISRSRTIQHKVNENSRHLTEFTEGLAQTSEDVAIGAEKVLLQSKNIVKMAEQVQEVTIQIRSLLGNIKDIAQTIKLLGINLLIEAAHTGGNGRGLEVVAKEISNLSNNVSNLSIDISNLSIDIEETLKTVEHAVKEMTNATVTAMDATEKQAAASQELSASVREVFNITRQLLEIAREL